MKRVNKTNFLASTLVIFAVTSTSATAANLESIAGAFGGQTSCGTAGTPPNIQLLFGSMFGGVGTIGNGISDCNLQGSIQDFNAGSGPLTATNAVSATVGGGPYTGSSSSTSNYGNLSVAAHGEMLGVSNTAGVSQSGGFAIFNDQLTFMSLTQANGTAGSVAYTFTIGGALTTPVPTPPFASQNLASLNVKQNASGHSNVFSASTFPFSNGTIPHKGSGLYLASIKSSSAQRVRPLPCIHQIFKLQHRVLDFFPIRVRIKGARLTWHSVKPLSTDNFAGDLSRDGQQRQVFRSSFLGAGFDSAAPVAESAID